MSQPSKRRLGEILVERGFVSPEQLREALRSQYQEGKRLGEILIEMGALTADELNWALSELLGIPYVEFREEMVDLDLARALPEEVLRRHETFPVLRVGDELTVILTDPTNSQAVVELEAITGARVSIAIASRETVLHLLDKAFPPSAARPAGVRYADVAATSAATPEADPTGVAHVYTLLLGALREEATEIHVEPLPEEVRVRNRVDGRLVERARLPRSLLGPVISRFRILAGLRGESLPHQTHVRTRLEQQEVELELLFFPTIYGEAVTVKISQRRTGPPSLDGFELEAPTRETLLRLAGGAGLVFVTGWDPLGRASLLYALAQAAAAPTKKVVTLERAVSFVVPDFVQVEMPGEFAEGAATILTHPADVLLVEDLSATAACLAAIGSAEQGALVLGGLALGTNSTGLAHLLGLDVPRGSLLGATTGLANVHRHGARHRVGVLAMDDELRHELLTRQGPPGWTSRTS
ncbi:MAG TPA: ATPase, T2SS/T4P/T4SS family [Methylomirabilota bacterium]|nr:ATPase, T2SS/T4P/T4SS family [Methylomirabilota bacterium]